MSQSELVVSVDVRPKLTICMLTKTDIRAETVSSLFELINDAEFANQVDANQTLAIGNSDLPKTRSAQLSSWYEGANDGDYFMFIDADQTFTPKDVLCAIKYSISNRGVVCGAYCRQDGTITVQPFDIGDFYREKKGELYYGATGFMLITRECVRRVISQFKLKKVRHSGRQKCYPFFQQRIVQEKDLPEDLWLSEDYSFCWMVRQTGQTIFGFISSTIGHVLTVTKMIRDPKYFVWPENSIVFYCGYTAEDWNGDSMTKGIGGSEQAVILLTRYWQQRGWNCTVYCSCNSPGVYDGVTYHHYDKFRPNDHYNIFISWRAFALLNLVDVKARKVIVDLHDVPESKFMTGTGLRRTDLVCVKSQFHRQLLLDARSHRSNDTWIISNEKIVVIPNGGAYSRNNEEKWVKNRNKVVYASSYDRGLPFMLKYGWPRVMEKNPSAELHIFYGWNTFDAMSDTPDHAKYKDMVNRLMMQPGVFHHGKLPHSEAMKHKKEAAIHYYVGVFDEIDCITIRESASVDCVPVVADSVKVFGEKDYCLRVQGDPTKEETQLKAADLIVRLMTDDKFYSKWIGKCQSSLNETWDLAAQQWCDKILNTIEQQS